MHTEKEAVEGYKFYHQILLNSLKPCEQSVVKAYTKKGDKGYTKDYAGRKHRKDNLIIVVGGKIDALQSAIDAAMLHARGRDRHMLDEIQRKLWQTAAEISKCDKKCLIAPVTERDLKELENFIDKLGRPPTKFVRFITRQAIVYNECRVRARELETFAVKLLAKKQLRRIAYDYLNRLSSAFFMLAYKSTK